MLDRLFLPETVSEALDTDLATGLRAIADALEGGHLDGRHVSTIAAAGGRHDDRIHLRVSLDLAAPILQSDASDASKSAMLLHEHAALSSPQSTTSREDSGCTAQSDAANDRKTKFEPSRIVDRQGDLVIDCRSQLST